MSFDAVPTVVHIVHALMSFAERDCLTAIDAVSARQHMVERGMLRQCLMSDDAVAKQPPTLCRDSEFRVNNMCIIKMVVLWVWECLTSLDAISATQHMDAIAMLDVR